MNLISSFLETARRQGPKPAIVSGAGETISFDALARRSGRLASTWRTKGIKRGDIVLVAMPVGIELYVAIAALWRLGVTIVFPEPAMGVAGVRRAVEITRPRAVLFTGAYRLLPFLVPRLLGVMHIDLSMGSGGDDLEDVSSAHPALISFTSGSTGRSKAIVRSHGFLASQNAALEGLIAPRRQAETDLVAFPVFVIANLSLGTTSVLPNWRLSRHDLADPHALLAHARDHAVTRVLVPPSICEVLSGPGDAPSFDTVLTGGGPVFPDLLERLARRMPGIGITTVYGSTEAEPIAHQAMHEISAAQWTRMKSGGGLLAGRPINGVSLRIREDEILVSGAHVNKGYLGGIGDAENKVHSDGEIWHRTGDAGYLDDKGLLWLRGRLTSRAGHIYPFDIEVTARSWPGVTQAALVPGTVPPILALDGMEGRSGEWKNAAGAIGDIAIVKIKIPLDRRHRSKVDYIELRRRISPYSPSKGPLSN